MTYIYFDLDWQYNQGPSTTMDVDMVFDRFDPEDRSRCIFKENPGTSGHQSLVQGDPSWQTERDTMWSQWNDVFVTYFGGTINQRSSDGRRFDYPPYQLRIKWQTNDTELPALHVDVNRHELSFEWQGMFDRFYREEEEVDKRHERWFQREKPKLDGLTNACDTEDAIFDTMESWMAQLAQSRDDKRRDVRRIRIKQFYQQYNFDFSFDLFPEDEERALEMIEVAVHSADLIDFSEDDDDASEQASSDADEADEKWDLDVTEEDTSESSSDGGDEGV